MTKWKDIKNDFLEFKSDSEGNRNHKYASLNSITKEIKEKIKKENILIKEKIVLESSADKAFKVHIIEVFEDDKMVDYSSLPIPVDMEADLTKIDPYQREGKGVTYIRRYNYSMLMGITDTEDMDEKKEKKEVKKTTPMCVNHPEVPAVGKKEGKFYCKECADKLKEGKDPNE